MKCKAAECEIYPSTNLLYSPRAPSLILLATLFIEHPWTCIGPIAKRSFQIDVRTNSDMEAAFCHVMKRRIECEFDQTLSFKCFWDNSVCVMEVKRRQQIVVVEMTLSNSVFYPYYTLFWFGYCPSGTVDFIEVRTVESKEDPKCLPQMKINILRCARTN